MRQSLSSSPPCVAFLAAMLLTAGTAHANDLTLTEVALVDNDQAAGVLYVQFDVAWNNSWRLSSGPANHDAAWLFVKYRRGDGLWRHATLGPTGNTAPAGAVLDVAPDGTGAFLYRAVDGTGDVSYAGVRLRWDYRADGVADDEEVDVDVLGIEMVYVPEGAFYLGSGGDEAAAFYTYPDPAQPYHVTSEDAIPAGATEGALYFNVGSLFFGAAADGVNPVPAAFPKGFAAFYIMKYELTFRQYVDFLNTLTYEQQAARTSLPPSSPHGTKVIEAKPGPSAAVPVPGIEIFSPGAPGTPAVYAMDLTDDGQYDQADDGQERPCAPLNWGDGLAYADWAGVRPMTELEFEKAGRGPRTPVPNEYAWGSTRIVGAGTTNYNYVLSSLRTASERVTNPVVGVGNAQYLQTPVEGQHTALRVGVFAASVASGSRIETGASYYGVMELSGNAIENVVAVNTLPGLTFTGAHGDGSLTGSGTADVTGWPSFEGNGLRGGAYMNGTGGTGFGGRAEELRLSDRLLTIETSNLAQDVRYVATGWRGVRTAP